MYTCQDKNYSEVNLTKIPYITFFFLHTCIIFLNVSNSTRIEVPSFDVLSTKLIAFSPSTLFHLWNYSYPVTLRTTLENDHIEKDHLFNRPSKAMLKHPSLIFLCISFANQSPLEFKHLPVEHMSFHQKYGFNSNKHIKYLTHTNLIPCM